MGSKKAKRLFKELPLYKALIEKRYIKRLDNIDMLHELPIYDELSIIKTWKLFKRYAISYSIEIIVSKKPSVQLTVSKPSIKDLFKDLLDEIKGLKITLKVLLSKYKENADRKCAPV